MSPATSRRCRLSMLGVVAMLMQNWASAQPGDPRVVITGGPDATGQAYTWVVANQNDSPVIGVEIPHFRGGLFTAPKGWTTDCTNLVGVGVADELGVCKAAAESTRYFVARPHTATFHLQLAAKGAKQGVGKVRVYFADGTDALIGRVILPVRESLVERFSPVVGLALIGVLLIAIGGRRRRRATTTPDGSNP